MKKTSRIEAAQDILKYLKDGYYILDGKKIDISDIHKKSLYSKGSVRFSL